MCNPTSTLTSTKEKTRDVGATQKKKPLRMLVSLDSYSDYDQVFRDERPSMASCTVTGILFVGFLFLTEHAMRFVFDYIQTAHPILEDETNRQILARHVGVDAFCCFLVAFYGWRTRHVCEAVPQAAIYRRSNSMPDAGHESRLYTYHPAAFRVALFFFFFQIKNLYDTIVWNDGLEFIFHHVFSLFTSYGAMSAGVGMYYCIFFFGLSEVSTGILCILANFDDEFGVQGLGDAFPLTKAAIGATFVVAFIICRVIFWPMYSYYFGRDVLLALKGDDKRTSTRRGWLKFFLISLSSLSVLQVAWLGQIFLIARDEITKLGLL